MKNVNKYNKQRTTRNLFRLITRVAIKVMFASPVLPVAPRPSNSVEKTVEEISCSSLVVSLSPFLRHLRSILVAREIYFYDAGGEINDAPYIRIRNPREEESREGKKSLFYPILIKLSISASGTYVFQLVVFSKAS